jgi:uncharacterized protein (DUF488 family)
MDKNIIWTVGYQGVSLAEMSEALKSFGITDLVDVRSITYSKANPDFCSPWLERKLPTLGIRYRNASEWLGGKPKDKSLWNPATKLPDYAKMAQTASFATGLKALVHYASKGLSLALMCMEADAADCHRARLVGQALIKRYGDEIEVRHLRKTGGGWIVENHDQVIQRAKLRLKQIL